MFIPTAVVVIIIILIILNMKLKTLAGLAVIAGIVFAALLAIGIVIAIIAWMTAPPPPEPSYCEPGTTMIECANRVQFPR
jgi:CHASE2 domain-containing sensor protein